ncbi:hypothetical protein BC937DRAFT_94568 [Endogone sp. FLAS-F59071]|nr:hypothetical protein BC937DRAFT_94568 [Endogone sp. FLAS-F59071]|eukprot:RUS13946.1 hypothetical protein BC937DRAFT_94568 [Endogone sp. FLAS-F59071]
MAAFRLSSSERDGSWRKEAAIRRGMGSRVECGNSEKAWFFPDCVFRSDVMVPKQDQRNELQPTSSPPAMSFSSSFNPFKRRASRPSSPPPPTSSPPTSTSTSTSTSQQQQHPATLLSAPSNPSRLRDTLTSGSDDTFNDETAISEQDLNIETAEDAAVAQAVIDDVPDPNRLDDDEDEWEDDEDPVLTSTTERNRHITTDGHSAIPTTTHEDLTAEVAATARRLNRLSLGEHGFSEAEDWDRSRPDRLVISFWYGLTETLPEESAASTVAVVEGADGSSVHSASSAQRAGGDESAGIRRSRAYLVATDFSPESLYAVQWAMGTVLRNGDEVHVATIVDEDHATGEKGGSGKDAATGIEDQLQEAAAKLYTKTREILSEMLLYNIKTVVHAIIGKTKDALMALIDELPLTMVVVGSRGLNSIQGFSLILLNLLNLPPQPPRRFHFHLPRSQFLCPRLRRTTAFAQAAVAPQASHARAAPESECIVGVSKGRRVE